MPVDQLTETTASVKTEKRYYRPELDALRFVAFGMVFCYHISYFREHRGWLYASVAATGGYGMSLFFVLSSYLITTLLIKERERTGTVAIGKFYTRRVLRIWPLYIVFLVGMYFVGRVYAPWFMRLGNLAAFFLLWAIGTYFISVLPDRSCRSGAFRWKNSFIWSGRRCSDHSQSGDLFRQASV